MQEQDWQNRPIVLSVSTPCFGLEELLGLEWLLTNRRGGFASGTVIGCPTRRYHSILIGSHNPPANRIAAWANCLEMLTVNDYMLALSTFEFDRTFHPRGWEYQTRFYQDGGVHFVYELGLAELVKSIYLSPSADIAAVVYEFDNVCETIDFAVRPFAAMRDFHTLQHQQMPFFAQTSEQKVRISTAEPSVGLLTLAGENLSFVSEPQWWRHFLYRIEQLRGQDCFEDLWSPGLFKARFNTPQRFVIWGSLHRHSADDGLTHQTVQQLINQIEQQRRQATAFCPANDIFAKHLFIAADQFLIHRQIDHKTSSSILAGFPWFLDWGRDTFISLEGLCLCTRNYEQALSILSTFAAAVSEGMIPNRFDDYGNPPHYNSMDASLWFVHAAFRYLKYTGQVDTFSGQLLPAIEQILRSYYTGTRFGIHADSDGLICGGDASTQLTWMDAKYNNVAFTPRFGKPVEINALWINALHAMAHFLAAHRPNDSRWWQELADKAAENFRRLFWYPQEGYLYDVIYPDGTPDISIRPNQIFAVSLPYSPLTRHQQHAVVQTVQQHLLTPRGLRTLSPHDKRYHGRYMGDQAQRDAAYHQGTVWPWLMGHFVEAFLKTNEFNADARRKCRMWLSPMMRHLEQEACIGSISEIFDGDAPYEPRGAFAQAWSVAEILRAWLLINQTEFERQ